MSAWLLIAFSLFCAGAVKGIFGMGLPAVSLGLLSLAMPTVEAAALIVVPTLATNLWQFMMGPQKALLVRRFATLLVGVVVGTMLGVGFLTGTHTALVSLALGGVLILYAVVGLRAFTWRVPVEREFWASPVVGMVTGLINGATGVSVMPLVPYLNSVGLARDALIQAMGLVFIVAMVSLATCLAWTGHFELGSARASTLALLPVFAGMYLGQVIRVRLHADDFRKWFFVGLLALGGYSALRALVQVTS